MSTPPLCTQRLELVPMTLEMVEEVMLGHRERAEELVRARMPARWPNHELVERAFTASLDAIRADPGVRLWGNRVLIAGGRAGAEPTDEGVRRVVGSVVFHGRPASDGIAEIAYGIEEGSQGRGFATEAVRACVDWALAQEPVRAVQAATFAWHVPSMRVLTKAGLVRIGERDHETMGEMIVFERRAPSAEG
jgi:RimJ/RimL family protein N-acetyltransferase